MKKRIEYSDYIQKYLDDEMSTDEILVFEQKLICDHSFKVQFDNQKRMNDLISDNDLLKFNSAIQEAEIKFNFHPRLFSKRHLKTVYKFAAVFLVIALFSIVTYIFIQKPDNNELFEKHYRFISSPQLVRGTGDSENLLSDALREYDKHNFGEAVSVFNKLLLNDKENYIALFYLGLSYIELEEYQKAIQYLIIPAMNDDNFYKDQAGWNLALCYIKIGQNNDAIIVLEQLSEDKNNYYKTEAENILNIIRE